jgi:hypothetical protein
MSIGWMVAVAWATLMSIVWLIFTPAVLSWPGLAVVGLLTWFALAAALTAATQSSGLRSVTQVIADAEAEPAYALARAPRDTRPDHKTEGVDPR